MAIATLPLLKKSLNERPKMIDRLSGTIAHISEKGVTLEVSGVGFDIALPRTTGVQQGTSCALFTYLHWIQDKGPRLYGFESMLDRTIFLLIIECPKIGPSTALNVLSSMTAHQFIEAISSQNSTALSSVQGIGAKTAEQIIAHLRHKMSKLISQGQIKLDDQQKIGSWHQVSEALLSLNYSRQEVDAALRYLTETYANKQAPVDQLIRAGLSYLSRDVR